MDEVERYIAVYREFPFDANGEAWGKVNALEALEKFLPNRRVLDFFLSVIADPAEYDMARVYLLKLFEVNPLPSERQRIGECVAGALPGEKDWTVRCWLGRAVSRYNDIPEARAAALARVLDPEEDLDVRHNCLFLLGQHRSDQAVARALTHLVGQEGPLRNAARRELESCPAAPGTSSPEYHDQS